MSGEHFGSELPSVERHLDDAEYRMVQNNIVIACTDILVVNPEGKILSSFRQQKPQEGYWFSCGGRMQRGKSFHESATLKLKDELGIDADPDQLTFIGGYSTAFRERAQAPQKEGVHTANAVLILEAEQAQLDAIKFNEEHESAKWFFPDEIIEGKFPEALQVAVSDYLETRRAYPDRFDQKLVGDEITSDILEMFPGDELIQMVPEDHSLQVIFHPEPGECKTSSTMGYHSGISEKRSTWEKGILIGPEPVETEYTLLGQRIRVTMVMPKGSSFTKMLPIDFPQQLFDEVMSHHSKDHEYQRDSVIPPLAHRAKRVFLERKVLAAARATRASVA